MFDHILDDHDEFFNDYEIPSHGFGFDDTFEHPKTPTTHDQSSYDSFYDFPAKPNHSHEDIESKINELELLLTALTYEITTKINELSSEDIKMMV